MKRSPSVAALVVLMSVSLVQFTQAATFHVPSDDYPTIQAGLDAASSGDTVLVAPGVFTGPGNRELDFHGKSLALISELGPDATIIDIGQGYTGIRFDDEETAAAKVDGFTLRNGRTGIICNYSSPTIVNCVIRDNTQSSPVVTVGGGIFTSRSFAEISNCVISGNVAEHGGGIYIATNPAPRITNCTISGNTATTSGGGIKVFSAAAIISDCTISGNSAKVNGGGVDLYYGDYSRLTSCVISGNAAGMNGGAVHISDSDHRIYFISCTISGNSAEAGGGSYCIGYSISDFERSIIWGNCSDSVGDEAYLDLTSDMVLTCCAIDSSGIEGDIYYIGEQVFADPIFCNPEPCENAPTVFGDYTLRSDSPCLPESSPCGELIGALGHGCTPAALPGREDRILPERLMLSGPRPNPTSDAVRFRIGLPERERLRVRLYDIRGRLVEILLDRELGAGYHHLVWDLRSSQAGDLSKGIYYILFQGKGIREAREVRLVR